MSVAARLAWKQYSSSASWRYLCSQPLHFSYRCLFAGIGKIDMDEDHYGSPDGKAKSQHGIFSSRLAVWFWCAIPLYLAVALFVIARYPAQFEYACLIGAICALPCIVYNLRRHC